jgi:transporter family-2 protein
MSARYALSVLAGVGAGLLLSAVVRVNATLGTKIGEIEATFVIHLVGTLFALVLVSPWLGRDFWTTLSGRPWVEFLGGVLSVAMVLIANLVVPHLGTALAVSLFVTGDLFFSSVSDRAGWMKLVRIQVSRRRVAGLLLALAGVLLVHWG